MKRRAIVKILFGKASHSSSDGTTSAASTKRVLEPGAGMRVGRDEDLELSLPHDRALSGHHFSLDWTGQIIRLRDAASLGGLTVNGAPFVSGVVEPGSYFKAGETVFQVFVEAASAPFEPDLDPSRLQKANVALGHLRTVAPLFGVFDAARDARIRVLLDESIDDVRSLYEGSQGDAMADVAPYLVRFSTDSTLLDRIVIEGWARGWGIFFVSNRPWKDVRRHLRRFLMVEPDDAKERLYFRYYDPRVLREFLPIATRRQRSEIFGDISSFMIEGEGGDVMRVDPFETTPSEPPEPMFGGGVTRQFDAPTTTLDDDETSSS